MIRAAEMAVREGIPSEVAFKRVLQEEGILKKYRRLCRKL